MKKNVRIIAIVLALVIISALFAGCSVKSRIVGRWSVDKKSMETVLGSEIPDNMDISIIYNFNKNGTGKWIGYENNKKVIEQKFYWKMNGNKLFVKYDADSEYTDSYSLVTIRGKKLTLKNKDIDTVISFTRSN